MGVSLSETNPQRETQRGFGLAVDTPREVVVAAASAVQDNGYVSFWLNNPPRTRALEALGYLAQQATEIALGVGVIPLADRPPEEIVREVVQTGLPQERLYLGIGSGAGGGGVERVAQGLGELRPRLECRLVVAALGPRMCRLAGETADGVLFNWVTPDFAKRSIEWVSQGAESAGRPMPRLMAYVRVALGDGAVKRLEREAANYEGVPHYAAHFKRMGSSALQTAVTGSTREDIQRGLRRWEGVVDEVVVRGITAEDTVEGVVQLVEAARPAG